MELLQGDLLELHCAKRVRSRSYSSPHFPAFGLNKERYSVSLRIQSECGKIRENADQNNSEYGLFFYTVLMSNILRVMHCEQSQV